MKIHRKKLSLFAVVIVFCAMNTFGFCQPPDTLWTRWFGGSGEDYGRDVEECVDGFIVVGLTASFGSGIYDAYVIRLDLDGDTVWTRTYGGVGREEASSVIQVADGYVFSGYTSTHAQGVADMYLVKFSAEGDIIWTKQYDADDSLDQGYCVKQTSDDGFIVTGFATESGYHDQVYLVKTDANGNLVWDTTYGGIRRDYGRAVQQTADGGYIIAGYSYSFGGGDDSDVWLLKTDSSGDILWTRTYGSPNGDEQAFDILIAPDSGYIMFGTTQSFGSGWYDVYVIRTEADGDTVWTRTYGGSYVDIGRGASYANDGNIVIVGETYSYGTGENDVYLLKIDMDGNLVWSTTFGGTLHESGYAVKQTADDEYIICGRTRSFGAGQNDFYVIRTGPDHSISEGTSSHVMSLNVEVNPNPFRYKADIRYQIPSEVDSRQYAVGSIIIYDIAGQLVKSFSVPTAYSLAPSLISWDGTDNSNRKLGSGVYFLKFQTGDYSATEKILLIR